MKDMNEWRTLWNLHLKPKVQRIAFWAALGAGALALFWIISVLMGSSATADEPTDADRNMHVHVICKEQAHATNLAEFLLVAAPKSLHNDMWPSCRLVVEPFPISNRPTDGLINPLVLAEEYVDYQGERFWLFNDGDWLYLLAWARNMRPAKEL